MAALDATRRLPPLLPALTRNPQSFPGCCLALSAPLVDHVRLSSAPGLTLSIGSGSGLLEAYLATQPASHVVGVEVEPSPNQYLPASHHRRVHGTRFLEPLAQDAATWLFVYPRRVGLVREYLDKYGQGTVQHIIWIGPQVDWDDYVGCFAEWDLDMQSAHTVGGRAWDVIAVAKRRHSPFTIQAEQATPALLGK
ncbi:hypothetical protein ACEQ8H_005444 [Pleosporales sp. CAS-2024a]